MSAPLSRPKISRQQQAHLGLGRVHVHVDFARRHLQKGDHDGVAATGDGLAVGLGDGLRQCGAVDGAAVDEDELLFAVAARPRGSRGQAVDAEPALGGLEAGHVADDGGAQQVARAVGQRRGGAQVEQDLALGLHQPARVGVGQGQLREQAHHRALLGLRGLHELAAGGRVVEQVAHRDRGAAIAGRGFAPDDLAALDLDEAPHVAFLRAADAAHAADRGDARECFSPEPERADAHDVGRRGDLAGGVAFEGEGQVAEGDAVAVVVDGQ
jgi:hypothetical protein